MRHISTLLPILFLAACASGTPYTTPSSLQHNQARIVIYRPSALPGALGSVEIDLDGEKKANLWNDGFISIDTTPGDHKLKASYPMSIIDREREFNPQLHQGETKYYAAGWNTAGMIAVNYGAVPVGHFNMVEVKPEQALKDLKDMMNSH